MVKSVAVSSVALARLRNGAAFRGLNDAGSGDRSSSSPRLR
jgi:hypothetical protein